MRRFGWEGSDSHGQKWYDRQPYEAVKSAQALHILGMLRLSFVACRGESRKHQVRRPLPFYGQQPDPLQGVPYLHNVSMYIEIHCLFELAIVE